MTSKIRPILGTMEISKRLNLKESEKMVKAFVELQKDASSIEIDTAYMYGGGKTEEFLGQMSCGKYNGVKIATKVNPWDGKLLDKEGVRNQFETSLKRMQIPKVHLLYLHAPDYKTSVLETLEVVNDLYSEGKFEEFGLSNYAAWQVAEIQTICKTNSWIVPTVYQGMYNCLTRMVEKELFPCLRHYGMRFYAYNPLCGGILTGKHLFEDASKTEPGRFFGSAKWTKVYRDRFWKKEYFEAVNKIQMALNDVYGEGQVKTAEAVYRWLYHHSALNSKYGDGVILGASRMEHLHSNFSYADKPQLDSKIVDVFEECWATCAHLCPDYMR